LYIRGRNIRIHGGRRKGKELFAHSIRGTINFLRLKGNRGKDRVGSGEKF